MQSIKNPERPALAPICQHTQFTKTDSTITKKDNFVFNEVKIPSLIPSQFLSQVLKNINALCPTALSIETTSG